MSVEFKSNGTLLTRTSMGAIEQDKTGSWKMLSFDEPTSTMQLECILGMQQTNVEVTLIDEQTIEMIPPNMAGLDIKLRFRRAGER